MAWSSISQPFRFSVIIPNHNYAAYVGAAIQSALNVDWPDVEVIVVDDGSTDHSRRVIGTFGDRIKAIFQPHSTQRVACNVGFQHATGSAVMFLDSDDMLSPSIAHELDRVWRTGLSKVQFQMMRIDAEGRCLNSVFPVYKPLPTPERILQWASSTTAYPTPPGSGNVYSRAFLEEIFPLDDSCGAFSDSACLASAPFLGDVETIAKPLVFYRIHGRNDSDLTRDPSRFVREIVRAKARFDYSRRHQPGGEKDKDVLIFNSLNVLQLRVAARRLEPDAHPLPGDSWFKTLVDAIRVPWVFPAATRRFRLIACGWAVLTLVAPRKLARWLIMLRYKAG